MKLPESEDQFKESFIPDILSILFVIIIAGIMAYCLYSMANLNIRDRENMNIESSATIYNIYRIKNNSNYKYYIMVSTKSYGRYEIEISKSDFMDYKIDDKIKIKIKKDHASIIVENINP